MVRRTEDYVLGTEEERVRSSGEILVTVPGARGETEFQHTTSVL